MKTYNCIRCKSDYQLTAKQLLLAQYTCPHCGQDNSTKARSLYRSEELKKRLNDGDFGFHDICAVPNTFSNLVYNSFTKIVYIHQRANSYLSETKETFCPFISPNGLYYKYDETNNTFIEIAR